jgi:hypothetical protein
MVVLLIFRHAPYEEILNESIARLIPIFGKQPRIRLQGAANYRFTGRAGRSDSGFWIVDEKSRWQPKFDSSCIQDAS